jgi:hypothetical protein
LLWAIFVCKIWKDLQLSQTNILTY